MLAIPNFSEGRDPRKIAALAQALTSVDGVRLLDVHTDPDHNRTVYTLAPGNGTLAPGNGTLAPGNGTLAPGNGTLAPGKGTLAPGNGTLAPGNGTLAPGNGTLAPAHHADAGGAENGTPSLADSLTAGAAAAIEQLDIAAHEGSHPYIGMLDVAPIVYMDPSERGAACAQALVLADRLGGELQIPVFLYGVLTDGRVTRAQIRRGGPRNLQRRIDAGELTPDFGPRKLHPRAGAVLVSARPPLIAFNVELAPPATLETAQEIAALIREGGPEGLPAVRAIGLALPHRDGIAQVSTNVEDYRRTSLATLVAAIARHATPVRAEVVGVPPSAAFDGFPDELPVANRRYLEDALRSREILVGPQTPRPAP